MMILAIEFSSPMRSVALLRKTTCPTPELLGSLTDEGARSVKPLTLIDKLLVQTQTPRHAVDTLIVGLGPGSYTGIRSAIALAQGWQLARGVQVAGISSVDCLAFQAQTKGWFGRVRIVIDAQRNEFYLATYLLTPDRRELLEPLRLVSRTELTSSPIQTTELVVGPEVNKWWEAGRVLCPEAAALGLLVPAELPSLPGERLEPIYLRESTFVKAPPARVVPD
jgi:tRNA threonylcarbamoyl adenosine modification protein YeaZ